MRMTPQQQQEASKLSAAGTSAAEISRVTGVPPSTIKDYLARQERPVTFTVGIPVELQGGTSIGPLTYPPQPFAVPIAAPATALPQQGVTALLYGDSHHPYQDEQALALVRAIAKDTQPSILIDMGDGVDCYEISDYDRDPRLLTSLQLSINATKRSLWNMANVVPSAKRYYLEGNHEDRLRRLICSLAETRAAQIFTLDDVADAVEWPNLLDLDGVGFEWIGRCAQPANDILPKILVEHGEKISAFAGWSARKQLEARGRSGASGHTHRLASYKRRDWNGVATWMETGFTAKYNQPYGKNFNWQQGCVFIEWSADCRVMQEHLISFRDGQAFWKQVAYQA